MNINRKIDDTLTKFFHTAFETELNGIYFRFLCIGLLDSTYSPIQEYPFLNTIGFAGFGALLNDWS